MVRVRNTKVNCLLIHCSCSMYKEKGSGSGLWLGLEAIELCSVLPNFQHFPLSSLTQDLNLNFNSQQPPSTLYEFLQVQLT